MTDIRLGSLGPFAWIDLIVLGWFAVTALSVSYVAWDAVRNNPEMKVMKLGWVLVTLYLGPLALGLYVLSCKEPSPGTHERFITPLWKQALGSTIHCVAGDATGIIVAAAITALLGLPMGVDFLVEYAAGFAFGLLIFQALFMKDLMGGSYRQAVRQTVLPEWLSMNFMMAGMFPTMVLLMMGRDMRAMDPTQPVFWGAMSVAVAVGLVVGYPVNTWLVQKGLKHGMGTVRALGRGGHSIESEREHWAGPAESAPRSANSPAKPAEAGKSSETKPMPAGPMASMNHGGMTMPQQVEPAFRPSAAQKTAWAIVSVMSLLLTAAYSAESANLGVSARDVRGVVMPPGMVMARDMPPEAMRDMSAVDLTQVTYRAPADARGDQLLQPRIENGVKVFDLDASVINWNILPYEQLAAYAFNRQVPGPRITLVQGDRVRINVTNHLPVSTSVHWHGLIVPNAFDGPAGITQAPIEPGGSYAYEFTVTQAGTFFYHSHDHADREEALGLYGALIVNPSDPSAEPIVTQDVVIQLQEWLERDGYTYPAMPMEGGMPNFFTINGKAYPSTDVIQAKVGDRIRFRFIGSNTVFIHPMHIHGGPFEIVATDGSPVPAGATLTKDTVDVGPGERYDVIWRAREPGKWLLHCHINHHTTNDNVEEQGGGGLTMIIAVSQ